MDDFSPEFLNQCRKKLLMSKQDALNGLQAMNHNLSREIGGDEGDIAQAIKEQDAILTQREKLIVQVREIDQALFRIEEGTYGMCEETEEPIEKDRLMAIPWTRLSIAGAEIRETQRKKFA